MANQSTSVSQLLQNEHHAATAQMPHDPSKQYANMPRMGSESIDTRAVVPVQPSGPSQGLSAPEGPSRKEFFGLKECDWRSAILVFILILLLSSGIFSSYVMRPYVPGSVGSDGSTTVVGSFTAAVLGVLLFLFVRFVGKF